MPRKLDNTAIAATGVWVGLIATALDFIAHIALQLFPLSPPIYWIVKFTAGFLATVIVLKFLMSAPKLVKVIVITVIATAGFTWYLTVYFPQIYDVLEHLVHLGVYFIAAFVIVGRDRR